MKKSLLLFVLLCCFGIGQAQLYQPFPTDSAVWRQASANWNYPDYYQRDYRYYTQGDTLLSGNIYHKVYKTEVESYYVLGSPTGPFNLYSGPIMTDSNKYMGAFREDLSKHVYFMPDSAISSPEILLYDFNLNLGDTLAYAYNNSSYFLGHNRVTMIDSVLVGTQYHKRFLISAMMGYSNYTSIIEGVGGSFGLLEMMIDPFEWSDNLICYTYNGQNVWADSLGHPPTYTVANCALPSPEGISKYSKRAEISVFPNPTTGTVFLRTPFTGKAKAEVSDVLGKVVYQKEVSSRDSELDLNLIPKGIYFLKVFSGKEVSATQKIILQ